MIGVGGCNRLRFAEVNPVASSNVLMLLSKWLPGGKKQAGEWVARNPTRSDRRLGSFRVNMRTCKWADFATSDKGGDLVSLYAYIKGCNQGEACDAVAEELGLARSGDTQKPFEKYETPQPQPDPKPPWRSLVPVPDDAPDITPEIMAQQAPRGTSLTALWDYYDARGMLLGHTARFDSLPGAKDPKKEIRPFTFCEGPAGVREWHKQSWPEPRPLYGLDRLASEPDAKVLVVEGEKAVDAAAERFPDFVVVTSPGGSNASRKADWSPLRGRHVVICENAVNNDPGQKYL